MNPVALAAMAAATAGVGAVGGLGGAVVLVPALVVLGMPPADAAPLGLVSVSAGSLAAGARQLQEGTVHHRLGVTVEIAGTAGAIAGAAFAGLAGETFLTRALAVIAFATAYLGGRRSGVRNAPDPRYGDGDVGEWPGSLAGAYRLPEGTVPYRARRLGAGLTAVGASGLVAGLTGASGGFIKTPALSELMTVPVKVAAATTTFTIGLTSAAGLAVMAGQGRVDVRSSAAVIAGSVAGGRTGSALQARLAPPVVRRVVSVVLVAVGTILLVR